MATITLTYPRIFQDFSTDAKRWIWTCRDLDTSEYVQSLTSFATREEAEKDFFSLIARDTVIWA